jgi:hypothetical protein
LPPTLKTAAATRSPARRICSKAAATLALLLTSVAMPVAWPPALVIWLTTGS